MFPTGLCSCWCLHRSSRYPNNVYSCDIWIVRLHVCVLLCSVSLYMHVNGFVCTSSPSVAASNNACYSTGPLLNTIGDFWRMIWKYKVTEVVMLTRQVERLKV